LRDSLSMLLAVVPTRKDGSVDTGNVVDLARKDVFDAVANTLADNQKDRN
jgi:hypothetical protein